MVRKLAQDSRHVSCVSIKITSLVDIKFSRQAPTSFFHLGLLIKIYRKVSLEASLLEV